MREGGNLVKRHRERRSSALVGALGLAVSVGLLLAPAPASAFLGHSSLGTFGAANKPSFTEPQGMAVDQSSGDLLVIDAGEREPGEGTLSRFHQDGTPADFSAKGTNVIEGLSFRFPETGQVAVDNSGGPTDGNIYVASGLDEGVVRIFDEDGNSLGQLSGYNAGPAAEGAATPLGSIICGVAVDPDGNVYLGEASNDGAIHKYEPAANPPVNADNSANFPFKEPCNVAAGAGPTEGFIFAAQLSSAGFPFTPARLSKLDSTTGAEAYEVDSREWPDWFTNVSVDPATGLLFATADNEVKEYDASGSVEATVLTPIAPGGESVNGIAVDGSTGNIYIARKGNPNIEVWGPAVELPLATTEAASLVGSDVTLHGTVNADDGPPTTCSFEYVEGHAKGFAGASLVPCSQAGPFTGTSDVAVSAEVEGLPEAGYRFRLVATNENGSTRGEALSFNNVVELGLPDGRSYEMVSPSQKAGEVIAPDPTPLLGGSCSDCLPGANFSLLPMQSTPDGESVLYEGQPFSGGLVAGPNEYIAGRASAGWASQSLSPPSVTGQYLAFSTDLSRGVLLQSGPALSSEAPTRGTESFQNLYLRGEGGSFQPLITTEPPNRDPGNFAVRFAAANAGMASAPAFEHLAFEANDALTEAVPGIAPAAPEVEVGKACSLPGANCDLYEWEGGELRLVNVLPGNAATAAGAVIGAGRMLQGFSPDTQIPANVDHAISEDGSRIFWSAEESGHVYVRIDGEETLEVPDPGSCKESVLPKERACFLTASPDGSAVLLSDGQVYELNGAGSAYVASADLSEGEGGFEGILGAAEDLSRVYFVDTKALTEASEENANGEHAEAGEFNLYGWDEGALTFIGILVKDAGADNGFSPRSYGAWAASPSNRTAQISADGSWLAFMSLASLTGYDNRRSGEGICSNGTPCHEVFVYFAGTKSLTCASCNPTGERPLGPSNLSLIRPDGPFPQPGNLSAEGSGRLFFESQDTLSPRDENGAIQDVYEWEPNGVGSCKRAAGCVSLISKGTSPNDSMFVDATPSGKDAFFITREQLLLRDKDEQLDLYDARVGGGIAEDTTPPCLGDACRGPLSSAPEQQSAGSSTFAGPGNEKPKKHKKHKKKRRKHQGHKRAAKHNRGGQK